MNGALPISGRAVKALTRLFDAAGLVLLTWLGWRMYFDFDGSLQDDAAAVAAIGIIATACDRQAARNIPASMMAFVAVGLASAAVHRWTIVASSPDPAWMSLFAPAHHLVVMAGFVYGAAYLLRTPLRLSWFAILAVTATVVLSAQIAFDRALAGFYYFERGGPSFESLPQWGGIHGTSLPLTIGLPLATVALATRPSLWTALLAVILAGCLFVAADLTGSRGGLVAMGVVAGSVILLGVLKATGRRLRAGWVGASVAIVAVAFLAAVWSLRSYFVTGADFSGRTILWQGTARLIGDHPWLGVGPGNYGHAINASGYVAEFPGQPQNAHNLLLHTSAEIGVIGGLCLMLFLAWALRACWRTWSSGAVPMVSLGILLALEGFVVRSLSDVLIDDFVAVERTRLLVWMIFAASLAIDRLAIAHENPRA